MEPILIILAVIAILAIGFILFYRGVISPELFFGLFNLLDCCATIGVFGITIVVTISGFLLWHSLLMAALAGGIMLVMMLIVLSVFAASYKPGGQSS